MYPHFDNEPFLRELCQGHEAIHQARKDNTVLWVGFGLTALAGCVLYWKLYEQQQARVLLPRQAEKR